MYDHPEIVGRTGDEVAFFVENTVVGQVDLPVHRPDCAVADDRRGVIQAPPAFLNEPDGTQHPGRTAGRGDDTGQGAALHRDEPGIQQQVLGRVAREGQLGEHRQFRGDAVRTPNALQHARHVAVQIPHTRIDLPQEYTHAPAVPNLGCIGNGRRGGRPPDRTVTLTFRPQRGIAYG